MVLVEQTIVDKTRVMKRGLAVFVTETEVTGGSRYGISSTDARNKEQVIGWKVFLLYKNTEMFFRLLIQIQSRTWHVTRIFTR